jgi:cytochrome P450
MAKASTCSTLVSESTRYVLNSLSGLYYGKKKPFPHLPHYESLTTADMFLSKRAFESTAFGEEIGAMTKIALQHPSKKCSVHIGGARGVLILDSSDLKEILEGHAESLETKESVTIFRHHFPRAVMSHSTGAWWRFLRNQVSETVRQLKKDSHKIIQIARDYVARLAEEQATEFDLKEIANSFTLEVIIRGFLGAEKTTAEMRHRLAELISSGVDEVVKLNNIAWLAIEESVPFYKTTLSSDKMLKEAEEIIRHDILEANKETIWSKEINWVTGRLKSGDQGKEINPSYDPKDIVNDISFLLTAGSETTAKHFAFTFIEVIQHPDVLKEVIKEVLTLGSPDSWSTDTFARTPYLDAVILESLRVHPPLPFRKVKVSKAFTTSDGTAFNPGDHIFINASATQRLESNYKNPQEFMPERFLDSNFELLISQSNPMKYCLQPFGMGPRSCPGAPLATLEVKVALACFVHAFNMSMDKPWNPENVVTTFSARPEQVDPVRISLRK